MNFENRASVEAPLARRVQYIVLKLIGPSDKQNPFPGLGLSSSAASASSKSQFTPPSKEEATQLKADLKEALLDLEKAVQIADIGKKAEAAVSPIGPIVSATVFSLGAVGVLILMIQISVMFIRYHLRLGELYDAQADALRASAGSPPLAYALLQHLSPNAIEVGKSPTSLYEKAFDAIQAVAKR